jgi:hypothetical protein
MNGVPATQAGKPEEEVDSSAELFKAYEGYSQTLRTWLVAYGVGGPVLLLTNEKLWTLIAKSGCARAIAIALLVGVALQVVLAALNKAVMWGSYYGEIEVTFRTERRYQVAIWLAKQFWIDFAVDLLSMVIFGWATYRVFTIVTGAA